MSLAVKRSKNLKTMALFSYVLMGEVGLVGETGGGGL
jgi:hypothetical protein